MQRVIYADVLVFVNTVITLLILLTSSDIINLHPSAKRYVLGSFVGGFGSLLLLAPEINTVMISLIKLLHGGLIVLTVFGFKNIRKYTKAACGFLLSSFLYGGISFFVQFFLSSQYVYKNNGYVYFDISAFGLIVICLSVFLGFHIIEKKYFKKRKCDIIYDVELFLYDKKYRFKALFDSGNNVVDNFTGRPVIILSLSVVKSAFCESDVKQLKQILSGNIPLSIPEGIRLLPIKTLGNHRMMPTLTADRATVTGEEFSKTVSRPSVVLSDDSFDSVIYSALINSDITGQVL